jgi:hypothetical protein
LKVFVRTVAQQQEIAAAVGGHEVGSKRWMELVRLHTTPANLNASLAGRLRLTPWSSVARTSPKLACPQDRDRPWDAS